MKSVKIWSPADLAFVVDAHPLQDQLRPLDVVGPDVGPDPLLDLELALGKVNGPVDRVGAGDVVELRVGIFPLSSR